MYIDICVICVGECVCACVCVCDIQYMSVRAWNDCVLSNARENIPLNMDCELHQINYYYYYYYYKDGPSRRTRITRGMIFGQLFKAESTLVSCWHTRLWTHTKNHFRSQDTASWRSLARHFAYQNHDHCFSARNSQFIVVEISLSQIT